MVGPLTLMSTRTMGGQEQEGRRGNMKPESRRSIVSPVRWISGARKGLHTRRIEVER